MSVSVSARGAGSATAAVARVSRAGTLLGAIGLASSLFVIWRLVETWRVTPEAASHRISLLGHQLTYPAANLAAVIVLGLALLGVAVIAIFVSGFLRELIADRRLRRRLAAHAYAGSAGCEALVLEDERPRAFCAGLLRPRIYVSTGTLALLDESALRAVLLHERQHARRRDPLRLACGRVLARALFFVPGLRELGRRHEALAELSADERAISEAPGNRAALARAMLTFAERTRPDDPTGLDPERIDHLLGEAPSWRFPLVLCLVALCVLALLGAAGALAGQIAAGSATLAPPFLSRQPCVIVLASLPALLGVGVLGLRRRGVLGMGVLGLGRRGEPGLGRRDERRGPQHDSAS